VEIGAPRGRTLAGVTRPERFVLDRGRQARGGMSSRFLSSCAADKDPVRYARNCSFVQMLYPDLQE
jgi:hypothetical protein